MRACIRVLALAAMVLLESQPLGLAADQGSIPEAGVPNEAFFQTGILLAGDSDMGCCVLKTSEPKCVYSNRDYCKSKAEQAGVPYEFHVGIGCKSLAACK